MAVLAHSFVLYSLDGLTGLLQGGAVPDRAVVVTFDDGYADNLHAAKPVLESHGVPATTFVVTGQVGSEAEFWWDELERLLLLPGRLPERLRVRCARREREWHLGNSAVYPEREWRSHRAWTVWERDDPTLRHTAYRRLHRLLRLVSPAEQTRVLAELRVQAQIGPQGRESHRALTASELRTLAEGSVVAIGAHTVTHPLLAREPVNVQAEEIRSSGESIRNLLGRYPTGFAYPYGGRWTFTGAATRAVRDAGFGIACTTLAAPVFRGADPLRLPRFTVRNWDGIQFERALERFFHGG